MRNLFPTITLTGIVAKNIYNQTNKKNFTLVDQSLRPLDEQLKTVCELRAQLGLDLLPSSSPHPQMLGPQGEEGTQCPLREETLDPGAVGSGPGRLGDKEDNPSL